MKKICFILLFCLPWGCTKLPPQPLLTRNQVVNDRRPMEKPQDRSDLKLGEFIEANSFHRLGRLADARTYVHATAKAMGKDSRPEAANLNLFDEVADSTWFTNRNARHRLSPEEIYGGPTQVRMAVEGPLTVVAGKSSGVTPGFIVKDSQGERFVLKFDPTPYCGISSGADVVGSRLAWAAGYNAPENNVEFFDPSRLVLGQKAKTRDRYNRKIPITEDTFRNMLEKLPNCQRDGQRRVLASRFLPGIPVGPFSYQGRRPDDPNDRIAHENRRELRGLTVLASWINHTDFRDYNTLDMWDPEGKYVTHYLIDFGGTLGNGTNVPKPPWAGYEHAFDFRTSWLNLISFGLREPTWKGHLPVPHPSVGNFRSEDFDPEKWRPSHPLPLFDTRTKRDGYWGAKLVASFSPGQIRAAVRAAAYPDPAAAEYVVDTLVERRNRIAAYWFAQAGPLDEFVLNLESEPQVSFRDWQRGGPWAPEGTVNYHWKIGERHGRTAESRIPLFASAEEWERFRREPGDRYVRVEIRPHDGRWWTAPTTQALFYLHQDGRLYWVGVER